MQTGVVDVDFCSMQEVNRSTHMKRIAQSVTCPTHTPVIIGLILGKDLKFEMWI